MQDLFDMTHRTDQPPSVCNENHTLVPYPPDCLCGVPSLRG